MLWFNQAFIEQYARVRDAPPQLPPIGFGQKQPIADSRGMTTPELIRAPLAAQRYSMSRRTPTRRMSDDPDFPRPIRMSKRLLLFKLAELDAYFERKRAFREVASA